MNSLKQGGKKKIVAPALFSLLLLTLPLIFSGTPYVMTLLCFTQMYVIAATGLDVLYGYSGQISFATAAFYGIGGYGSLLIHNYIGVPVFFSMIMAAVLSCLIAMILAFPVSKLRFAFLSLATISFNNVVYQLITRSPGGITGDFIGAFTDPLTIFGISFKSSTMFYYFGLLCCLVFVALKFMLAKSRVGRAFLAIKQNTHAADGMGVNVRKYKVYAFGFYGFYAAFASAMYCHYVGYISPETALQSQSVIYMIMILFGGICSNWGPVVGAIGIMIIQEILSHAEQYQLLVYGILLLIFILFLPRGVVGEIKALITNYLSKRAIKKGGGESC
ncbi:MAG: branched-chain amino acid ABC transporter permease [Oscillospiraceae bacterium]|nr:branched-chain amino acid ABC transporter permease [Oscillospiraceae bacterium]